MIVPRDYQIDAVNALWDYFASGKSGNPLVLMPTGTGKSIVIALFLLRALLTYPNTRAQMLTHVETLITQNFAKLLEVWPTAPVGINSAALKRRDTTLPLIFAGIQSVYRNAADFGFVDFVVIDEAHLVGTKEEAMYHEYLTGLRKINPHLKIIGLTATGWRMGLGMLTEGNIFTDIAIDMTTPEAWDWFVDMGYLAPLVSKRTNFRLDDSAIRVQGGEYVMSDQQEQLDKPDLNRRACAELIYWGDLENRRKWLLFATGVAHCEHLAEILCDFGVKAVALHSKTKNPQDVLAAYQAGEYRAAVSMNKLTTGVDAPGIDLIGVLRFTKSSSLWVQMLGRGTRPMYGDVLEMEKDPHSQTWRLAAMQASIKPNGCRVCDFAHNTETLGPINNPVVSAPKGTGKKRKGAQPVPVRVCPSCAEYVHASKQKCPCGYDFGFVARIYGEASEAEVMTRSSAQPEPVVELIEVERVTYHAHKKRNSDGPPSLRVSYYAVGAMRKFEEWICFEHEGAPKTRAHAWWRERLPVEWPQTTPAPETVELARQYVDHLRTPKRIRVWTNAPHPRIMSHEYD